MAHRSRSSRSATNTASVLARVSSSEAAGSSAPGGSGGETSATEIRTAVLEILADPEVIWQFGTAVAASSVPSTPGTTLGGTIVSPL